MHLELGFSPMSAGETAGHSRTCGPCARACATSQRAMAPSLAHQGARNAGLKEQVSHVFTPPGTPAGVSQLAPQEGAAPGGRQTLQGAAAAAAFPFMSSLRTALQDPRSPPQTNGALERAEKKHIFAAGRKRER